MPLRTMALAGATGRVGYGVSSGAGLRRAPLALDASGAEAFVAFVSRSLLIGCAVAAGLGWAMVGLGGVRHGASQAYAAVPSIMDALPTVNLPFPKPRIAAAPPSEEAPAPDAADLANQRVDRVSYDYLLSQLAQLGAVGSPDDVLTFGPMRIRRHLVQTIVKAAQATGTDPVLLMSIADKESSFLTAVQARTSSATGLFQFIESTWLRTVRDFGAKHGLEKEAKAINWVDDELVVADPAEKARILEMRRDPYISALLAAEMLKRDRARIASRIGRDLTDGETYLAHFLGPDDAERFMEKVVGDPQAAASKLLPKPARANKPIFFARAGRKAKSLSVAEVHRKFENMMGLRLDRYRNVHEVAATTALADTAVQ
jgi:hypothetical protein